jgi:hypothetical protein
MSRSEGRRRDVLLLVVPVVLVLVALVGVLAFDGGGGGPGADGEQATAAAPAPEPMEITLTDVTEEAGVGYLQHDPQSPPNCMFDGAGDAPLPEGSWSQAMAYVDCYEERFTGGVAVGDVDGDAVDDLYVTQLDGPGVLFLNRGDGSFVDRTQQAGLAGFEGHGNGAGFVDVDNDGDQDLYITTLASPRFYLYINDGAGTFTEEALPRGAAVADDADRSGMSVSFGDFDLDGYVDIHTTEWRAPVRQSAGPPEHARLLRNLGEEAPGHFEDVTEAAGVVLDREPAWMPQFLRLPGRHANFSFSSSFVDLDGDGHPELVVGSDFTTSQLFWNDGDGTFTEGTEEAGVDTVRFAMGSSFGDYDDDGDLDWFVSSIMNPETSCQGRPCESPYNGNRLYRNDGDREFADVTDQEGVRNGHWGWGTAFADLENDGDLDLLATNGQSFGDEDPSLLQFRDTSMRVWEHAGEQGYVLQTDQLGIEPGGNGKGLAVFDMEGDGDLDVFVANNGGPPRLYRNDGGDGNAMRVRVQGVDSNRDGLGAIVTVRVGDHEQVREIGVSTHFLGQSERVAHVGVGDAEVVDEVVVHFPATDRTVRRQDVPVDEVLTIVEPDA